MFCVNETWRPPNLVPIVCNWLVPILKCKNLCNKLEGGTVRSGEKGTKKCPGDLRFAGDAGAHGWAAAGSNELWVDVTVVCPLCITYLALARAARGAAAAHAGNRKRYKYRKDIPGRVHFTTSPFESEGYICAEIERLLLGFAHKKAARENLP